MYGEEILLGMKKIVLDTKNRIYVPKFTLVEEGDPLTFLIPNTYFIEVYHKNKIERLLREKEKLSILKGLSEEEAKKDLENFYLSICGNGKVDKMNRVHLPSILLEKFAIENVTIFQGMGNCSRIYKGIDCYEEYIKRNR